MNGIVPQTVTSKLRRCCATAVLLLLTTTLWAQEPVANSQADERDIPATNGAEAATSSETEAPAAAEPAASEPPASVDSPFDYQASEKISEDLSVSFPVDI